MSFVHLHVHSEYSLLDGAARIKDIVKTAKELGQTAIAITDHGVMYGAVDFYSAAKAEGIKPVLGFEAYCVTDLAEKTDKQREYAHLLLLAKNNTGYKNLMKLCSIGFVEGYYYKPRIDYKTLKRYAEGLICTSACLSGDIPQFLLTGRKEEAYALARELQALFGADFYIELQDHFLTEQKRLNPLLIELARDLQIKLIATNDVHYVKKEDARAQDVLMCLQMGRTLSEGGLFETDEFYIKSEEEMRALFRSVPEAIDNTVEIADKCEVSIELGKLHLPKFEVPEGYTNVSFLEEKARAGMAERYGADCIKYEERLCYELDTINKMGFTDYFLIVWDYIDFAHKNHIMVGPGRGSAAGSVVAYALKITNIDPLKYNLLFERFLNPERVSMPDIDIDFCIERRQEVIEYVGRKYGKDRVAQLITFGTLGAKQVVRDVARVMGISIAEANRVAKLIPFAVKMTIKKAMEESSELRNEYETNPEVKEWLDMAMRIEGLPRQSGTHAAAVVISKEPVTEYAPLSLNKKDESITTQYNMHNIEDLGLLKMDFLGLRTLTVIRDTLAFIKKNHGIDIDLDALDMSDPEVYHLMCAGETDGIFQLESDGMRSLMTRLRPENLGDIMVGISLFRPGPMAKIPDYIEGKNHPDRVKYDHPILEKLLKDTYGCMVYQEQVVMMVRDLAGYSLARSDEVRRAMAKKKVDVMEKERQAFIYGSDTVEGALKRGVSKQVANKVFDQMMDFAQYAFNKSHACAYAVVAYQTAYLKRHYPAEFMTALINSFLSVSEKVSHYIRYVRGVGIAVLPPDINRSEKVFSVEGGKIRFGLSGLANIGDSIALIIEERSKKGFYADFQDFVRRNVGTVNKSQLESLILSGCFDESGAKRSSLMAAYERIYKNAQEEEKRAASGQMSFFDRAAERREQDELPDIPEYEEKQKLSLEKQKLGIYLSGHPLQKFEEELKKEKWTISRILANAENPETMEEMEGKKVQLSGMFTQLATRMTKRTRQRMANGVFEDLTGSMNVLIFPAVYAENEQKLKTDEIMTLFARVMITEGEAPELMVDDLGEYYQKKAEKRLYLRIEERSAQLIGRIKEELCSHGGRTGVRIVERQTGKTFEMKERADVCDELMGSLKKMLGNENVGVK